MVDVTFEERYWYPDEGGAVWLAGYHPVDPADGRYLSRDDPELAGRGLRVAAVAGAARFHPEALGIRGGRPGRPLELRRDPDNPYDPNAAVTVAGGGERLGFVPRELAAELAPELDEGTAWSAPACASSGAPQGAAHRAHDAARTLRGDRAARGQSRTATLSLMAWIWRWP